MEPISQRAIEQAELFNEAEVRLHIIDPIIRKLGYTDLEGTYLKLEEKLNYPYYYIGRKNKKKDVPLGMPDYRAGLLGRNGSFVIEAKAGNVELTREELEQAHSYAAHAEVGAQYFVVSNGREFRIYETLSSLNLDAVVALKVDEINERFHEIENMLSPPNLERHSKRSYDLNLKLADGRSSKISIRDGTYGQQSWSYKAYLAGEDITQQVKHFFGGVDRQLEMLRDDFELRVGEGAVSRDADGRINTDLKFIGATRGNDKAMKLLGVDRIQFGTDSKFLSCDPENPTIFETTKDVLVPNGTQLPQMFGGAIAVDLDVNVSVYIITRMYLEGNFAFGDYLALADYSIELPQGMEFRIELDVGGEVSLRIAD